ncbi:MAG: CapA family protein [Patescibacteria group bacterium]
MRVFTGIVLGVILFGGAGCISPQQERAKVDPQFLLFKQERMAHLESAGPEVSVFVAGDIMLSRQVGQKMRQHGFDYPFRQIRDYVKEVDIGFANLETPITPGREIESGEMTFRADVESAQALRESGFTIVSLANNHTPNFGGKGLADTMRYLGDADILYVGAGLDETTAHKPVFIEDKGIRFAFLAYNDDDVVPGSYEAKKNHPGTAFMDLEKAAKSVQEAKAQADIVIVSMHAGNEYVSEPNESQVAFAHAVVDAGADTVIGHHPHVVQTLEQYKGKYIFYSLGNFIFDQMWSQETREGLALQLFFKKDGFRRGALLPIQIDDFSQPKFMEDGKQIQRIIDRLKMTPEAFARFRVESPMVDLNHNAIPEAYAIQTGRFILTEEERILWSTPETWWVDDVVFADSTNDGIIDINLSVWKAGNFGSSKPFWVDENDKTIKNHFFIFNVMEDGQVRPVWQSSNLEAPNCTLAITDYDGDGDNELLSVEGSYGRRCEIEEGRLSVWEWNGWGFSLVQK